MTVPALEIRPARPADLASLAAFIARANAKPTGHCLHCTPTSEVGIRASLRDSEEFPGGWERGFVVGTENSNPVVVATLGCQYSPDETLGYLWGPWMGIASEDKPQMAPALLAALLKELPPSIRRLDAFLHVENRAGLSFLQATGLPPAPSRTFTSPRAPLGSEDLTPGRSTPRCFPGTRLVLPPCTLTPSPPTAPLRPQTCSADATNPMSFSLRRAACACSVWFVCQSTACRARDSSTIWR